MKRLRIRGTGRTARELEVHAAVFSLIQDYLKTAGHGSDPDAALFRPVKNNRTKEGLEKALSPDSVYQSVVIPYAKALGISAEMFGPHALRATARTQRA